MKFILFVFLFINLYGDSKYSVGLVVGKATLSDFSEIIVGNWKGHPNNLEVISIDGGYKLLENYNNLPVDIYVKGDFSYYDEDALRDNNFGVTFFLKAYWKFDFLKNRVRLGAGEGVSYTKNILYTEYLEAKQEGDNNSKFLNYLELSLDFDVGKLLAYKPLYDTYIGWTLKHRSGIFGLINNVRRGGSNYNALSIEKTF